MISVFSICQPLFFTVFIFASWSAFCRLCFGYDAGIASSTTAQSGARSCGPDRFVRFLVALPPSADLLLCAKHLFVAARTVWVRQENPALRDFRASVGAVYVRLGQKRKGSVHALQPAHDESLCGTMFRPFPVIAAAPYLDDGKSSRPAGRAKAKARSGQAFQEGPGEAHARQGGAAGAAGDRAGARRLAQPRHRPGNRGPGIADRTEAAAGQFVRPARGFRRRAPRAQVDGSRVGRGAAGALSRRRAAGRARPRSCQGAWPS